MTGGAGARHFGEAFGEAYELPNDTTYCETCAAIANVMWNWRLLLATGESKYADMLERSLYNSVLSGVSLDGSRYFYENPLSSPGGIERPSWYGCACCPPNLMRLVELIAHYVLTTNSRGVQLHQYVDGEFTCAGDFGSCRLRVETGYPHDGEIVVTVLEGIGGRVRYRLARAWVVARPGPRGRKLGRSRVVGGRGGLPRHAACVAGRRSDHPAARHVAPPDRGQSPRRCRPRCSGH